MKDFTAISPITTVDSEAILLSGNPTLEDTINMYPQLNPDTTSASNQSGGDSNTQAQLYDTVGRRYYIGTTVGFGGR